MPTPPYAQLTVAVNGGAPQTGEVAATTGQTIQLGMVNSSGVNAQTWEIYGSPPSFNPGAGWSLESDNVTWSSAASTPAPFSTGTRWGKFMLRLRINGNPLTLNADGSPNASFIQQLTDESTAITYVSPTVGLDDLGYLESNQFSPLGFVGDHQTNLRLIENYLTTLVGTLALTWNNITHASTGAQLTAPTNVVMIGVTLNTVGGACLAKFPTNPPDGMIVRVADPPAGGSPGTGNWAAAAGQMKGATGQYVELPTAPGTFSALAGTVSMPSVARATQDFQWHGLSSSWLLV
jgi:hypothetical protein